MLLPKFLLWILDLALHLFDALLLSVWLFVISCTITWGMVYLWVCLLLWIADCLQFAVQFLLWPFWSPYWESHWSRWVLLRVLYLVSKSTDYTRLIANPETLVLCMVPLFLQLTALHPQNQRGIESSSWKGHILDRFLWLRRNHWDNECRFSTLFDGLVPTPLQLWKSLKFCNWTWPQKHRAVNVILPI